MTVLSDPDRLAVARDYMADVSRERGTFGVLTKAELRAAVNAADQWIDDNAASYNSALPLPARTVLSATQKTEIFLRVLRRRVKGN